MTRNVRTMLALGALACAAVLQGCNSADEAPPQSDGGSASSPAESVSPAQAAASSSDSREVQGASALPAPAAAAGGQAGPKDVTFDDIKLELKKGEPYDPSYLTPKVKELDGRAIRIRGFILPSFQQSGIRQFVLVRDNQECCFGPGALLHDCVLVEMVPPATTEFSTRAVSVEGKFSLRELIGPDGKHLAIYHLDGNAVK